MVTLALPALIPLTTPTLETVKILTSLEVYVKSVKTFSPSLAIIVVVSSTCIEEFKVTSISSKVTSSITVIEIVVVVYPLLDTVIIELPIFKAVPTPLSLIEIIVSSLEVKLAPSR